MAHELIVNVVWKGTDPYKIQPNRHKVIVNGWLVDWLISVNTFEWIVYMFFSPENIQETAL